MKNLALFDFPPRRRGSTENEIPPSLGYAAGAESKEIDLFVESFGRARIARAVRCRGDVG